MPPAPRFGRSRGPARRGRPAAGRVDGKLALTALNLFMAVKAFVGHAALAALDGLGVNDGHAWAGLVRGGRPPAVVCD